MKPVSKDFVLAGNATFTIELPPGHENPKPHYTYKVQVVEANGSYPEATFVKLLTGPDNESSYSYVGKLNKSNGQVITTAKSKLPKTAFPIKLLDRVLARVWEGDHEAYLKHGFKTHHEGRCGRCGRKLTVPESIESGIGPECAKKL